MCACAGAHLQMCMPARVQTDGRNYLGCDQPECSAPTSTLSKAAESDCLTLRLCNFYKLMFVHTPISISYVGSLHSQSCTRKVEMWKGLQGHR